MMAPIFTKIVRHIARFRHLQLAGPKGCVGYRVEHLGRKDDLKNINQDTLFKAAAELDKTFDKHMKRYVKSLLECVELMDKKRCD